MVDNTTEDAVTFKDAATALSQGKRHLLVRDYGMAVVALAQACSKLAEDHGDMSDELGEPFLLYGRALLGLSREEAEVLGSCMPENEDGEEEAEEDDDGEEEQADEDVEMKENAEKEVAAKKTEDKKENEKEECKMEVEKKEEMKESDTKEEKKETDKKDEKKEDDNKSEKSVESAAGSSTSASTKEAGSSSAANGEASTSKQNGAASENGDEDAEDGEEEEEEANTNLQVAWEVLELAKLILLKRGEDGWKLLAEAHRLLGEVAMESGNQIGALTDLTACLDLLRKIEPVDARSMAETHYQLGLAYSLGNEFDSSIEQFQEATKLLEARIKELESITEPPKTDDPASSVESEINELKELLPEIQEKIADMRDFKQQTAKMVIENIKSQMASGSCSNGAGPSSAGASSSGSPSSSSKPASDISHLVRKKRKTDNEESEAASPCKKPHTENSAS